MKLGPAPFLSTHIAGDTAWINVLYVPRDARRQGMGRRMVEQWLRSLPDTVRVVKLVAVDIDGGSSVGFWEKLGFQFESMDPATIDVTGSFMFRRLHPHALAA